jgi:hypothetical protein
VVISLSAQGKLPSDDLRAYRAEQTALMAYWDSESTRLNDELIWMLTHQP